jgi:hypothetical protein
MQGTGWGWRKWTAWPLMAIADDLGNYTSPDLKTGKKPAKIDQ